MNKYKNIKKILANNFFILRFLIRYVPLYVVLTIILYIAKGLLQSLSNVWLAEEVIDGIISGVSFSGLIKPVLMFSVYALIVGMFNAFYLEMIEKIYRQRFSDHMRMQLYKRAIDCDIACYDNSEFYDSFVWTAKEVDDRTFSVFQTLAMFIHRLTVISSTVVILSKVNLWILFVVLLSCILNYIFTLKQNKMQFHLNQKLNDLSRRKAYVGRTFILSDYAKELRTSKISQVLYRMFNQTNDAMESDIKLYSSSIWKLDFLKKLIGEDIVVIFTSIMILSWQVITKVISLGSFVASYNGVQVIYSSLSFILSRAAAFSDSSLYIEKFKKFWFYKPLVISEARAILPKETNSITFKNVSFSYEDVQNSILDDISFDLTKVQKVAIVGSNGAGKTTLVKLLLKLYDTREGSVNHNGINVKNLNLNSYRKRFSCLFQDYNLYACTLGENIAMSSTQKIGKDKLTDAIAKSGFKSKFETLRDGLDTIITRELNDTGILLSGGEQQKVAIARVLYQDSDCYVLDEPTAALDPVAETEFNRTIMEYCKNKLLVIISHRLTTTRFMDKIIVLDGGKIIETGSHEELISKGGRYAELYSLQAGQYS